MSKARMTCIRRHLTISLIGAFMFGGGAVSLLEAADAQNPWQFLEPGLEFGEFLAPQTADSGQGTIHVLRIDPDYFEFRLFTASSNSPVQILTAKEWCLRHDLVAAINASMYQEDYLTSVSLMRTDTHVNNPHVSKDKTILAFDRRVPTIPPVMIIDRQCENFEEWKEKYTTFVQSIRMISCQGTNVWRQQAQKKWSTAAIALDKEGRTLFIHVRSQYSTYDLINILLELPLQIARAMYVEGGRESQLYVRSREHEYEFVGSSSTGFGEGDQHQYALPIPNVVAITRKAN
jgi:hypothetical protein